MQPPDLAVGMPLRQCVQHGEYGRRTDPRADEQDRRIDRVEDEGAAWRRDVEAVTDGEPTVQISAGDAVTLALDGDAVVLDVGRAREGLVAEHRALVAVG